MSGTSKTPSDFSGGMLELTDLSRLLPTSAMYRIPSGVTEIEEIELNFTLAARYWRLDKSHIKLIFKIEMF